jgi:hypothetical protein
VKWDLLRFSYSKYIVLFLISFFILMIKPKNNEFANVIPMGIIIFAALILVVNEVRSLKAETSIALLIVDVEKKKMTLKVIHEATRLQRLVIVFYLTLILALLIEIFHSILT